jgi:hypothetical protein
MPRVGFESMIPVFERAKTVHTLDRAATVIGYVTYMNIKFLSEEVTSVSAYPQPDGSLSSDPYFSACLAREILPVAKLPRRQPLKCPVFTNPFIAIYLLLIVPKGNFHI